MSISLTPILFTGDCGSIDHCLHSKPDPPKLSFPVRKPDKTKIWIIWKNSFIELT